MPQLWNFAGTLCIVTGAIGATTQAAVFRCTVDGQALYTDRPCRAGDAPHALPLVGRMPAGAQADLAGEHDARRERLREAREGDDAAWLEAHAARKAHDRRMEHAIRQKRTTPGMSTDQVRRALGRPDRVERDAGGGERWTYRDGGKQRSVRFQGGKVVGGDRKAARRNGGDPDE